MTAVPSSAATALVVHSSYILRSPWYAPLRKPAVPPITDNFGTVYTLLGTWFQRKGWRTWRVDATFSALPAPP